MVRSHTLPRALAAALAIAAIAASGADAQPNDLGVPGTQHAATQSQPRQDLRSPDAKGTATQSQPRQDLRSPDARGGTGPATGPAAPQLRRSSPYRLPAAPRQTARSVNTGDDMPWALIGIGLAGACLAVGGTVAITGRSRRRTRVTA